MPPNTLGFHVVKSAHGLWLPGDDRGSWSEAWDPQIGYLEPHTLHPADPIRHRMAAERMVHPPVRLTIPMINTTITTLEKCTADSPWQIAAASIEPTHMHLAITASPLNIDRTLKWLSQEITKAIHQHTTHTGPVWCKNTWRTFVYDLPYWQRILHYIEQHNLRCHLPARPYSFITPT